MPFHQRLTILGKLPVALLLTLLIALVLPTAGRPPTTHASPSGSAITSLTVCKQVVPDDGSAWTFLLEGGDGFTQLSPPLANDDCFSFQNVTTGYYTLYELGVPEGYVPSVTCDNGESIDQPGIYLYLSESTGVSCTFVNQQYGSITIIQDAVPDSSVDFSFICTPGAPPLAAFYLDDDGEGTLSNSIYQSVPPFTYTCSEFPVTGWRVSITCDDADSTGTEMTATIVVSPAEDVTCTFQNVFTPGESVPVGGTVGLLDGSSIAAAERRDVGGAIGVRVIAAVIAAALTSSATGWYLARRLLQR